MTYLESVQITNDKIKAINNKYDLLKAETTKQKNKLRKEILVKETIVYISVLIIYTLSLLTII